MIICVLLCYPVSIHMSQLLSTERPISSLIYHQYILGCLMKRVVSAFLVTRQLM